MKRCIKCIMPETALGTTFDETGQCNLCSNYIPNLPLGIDELKKSIEENISNDQQFNCVVPVSGGRDSAYALFFVKRILGLQPLAVHNDNDFETEVAKANLNKMELELKVPLIRTYSPNKISMKIVSEKIKMNIPFGPAVVVAQTCEACKYGFESAAYNTARKYKINIIIWGDSQNESTASFHSTRKIKIPSKIARILSGKALNLVRYKLLMEKMKKQYGSNRPESLKEIHLYDYIEWDRKTIVDTIKREMGWEKPMHSATSWRIDCELVPLINFLTEKAYGVSKMELGFSSMIRSGKMTRKDAITQIEEIQNKSSNFQFETLLLKLKLSPKIIRKILF